MTIPNIRTLDPGTYNPSVPSSHPKLGAENFSLSAAWPKAGETWVGNLGGLGDRQSKRRTTAWKSNMEPKHGDLEDDFPFQLVEI